MVKAGLAKKGTFEKNREGGEGGRHMDIWGKKSFRQKEEPFLPIGYE